MVVDFLAAAEAVMRKECMAKVGEEVWLTPRWNNQHMFRMILRVLDGRLGSCSRTIMYAMLLLV